MAECGRAGFDLVLVEARHCLQDGALVLIDGEDLFHKKRLPDALRIAILAQAV